jgi:hypothetical protein
MFYSGYMKLAFGLFEIKITYVYLHGKKKTPLRDLFIVFLYDIYLYKTILGKVLYWCSKYKCFFQFCVHTHNE